MCDNISFFPTVNGMSTLSYLNANSNECPKHNLRYDTYVHRLAEIAQTAATQHPFNSPLSGTTRVS